MSTLVYVNFSHFVYCSLQNNVYDEVDLNVMPGKFFQYLEFCQNCLTY